MSHFGDGGKITLGFIFCKNSYQVRIRADITKVGFPRNTQIFEFFRLKKMLSHLLFKTGEPFWALGHVD